jgi:hypothetical protein
MRCNASIIHMNPQWVRDLALGPTAGLPDGRWVPARPIGFQSLRYRVRATWLVWTGRADALIWPGQQRN